VANADIVLSLQYNLAAPLLWAGFAGVLVHWAAESAGGRWRASWMGPLVALWMLAVLLVLLVGWARHLLH
jgi:hypothetical protein